MKTAQDSLDSIGVRGEFHPNPARRNSGMDSAIAANQLNPNQRMQQDG